jgi:hypothetical protein
MQSGSGEQTVTIFKVHFYPEYGGRYVFFQNTGTHLPGYTVSYIKRQYEFSPPKESQILGVTSEQ